MRLALAHRASHYGRLLAGAVLLFIVLLVSAVAFAAQPKRGALYAGTTKVGPWNFSFGGYVKGTTVAGPKISFRVTGDGKRIVKMNTTPNTTLGEPGYCGGGSIQAHEPTITIDSKGRFSGKRVENQAAPPPSTTVKITTTISGKFTGSGDTATGKFQILYRFSDPSQQCDEHGTFSATVPDSFSGATAYARSELRQSDSQVAQSIMIQLLQDTQKRRVDRWSIQEDIQTKIFAITQDVTVTRANATDKATQRIDAHPRARRAARQSFRPVIAKGSAICKAGRRRCTLVMKPTAYGRQLITQGQKFRILVTVRSTITGRPYHVALTLGRVKTITP